MTRIGLILCTSALIVWAAIGAGLVGYGQIQLWQRNIAALESALNQ